MVARWLAGGAAALVCAAVLFVLFPEIILAPATCRTACPSDLGRIGDHALNCEPATLTLELYEPRAKVGERYPLWYRATLRNETCFELSHMSAWPFMDGVSFRVTDGDGQEVAISTRSTWNDVLPYHFDPAAFDAMRNRKDLRFSVAEGPNITFEYISLLPGATVQTLPAVLSPGLNWLQPDFGGPIDVSVRNPQMKSIVDARIRGMKFKSPPPGFAAVDGYIFRKPGKYRIQAFFDGEFYQNLVYPRLDWYLEHVPLVVRRVIEWPYDVLMNVRFTCPPRSEDAYLDQYTPKGGYKMKIRSAPVEFEVIR